MLLSLFVWIILVGPVLVNLRLLVAGLKATLNITSSYTAHWQLTRRPHTLTQSLQLVLSSFVYSKWQHYFCSLSFCPLSLLIFLDQAYPSYPDTY